MGTTDTTPPSRRPRAKRDLGPFLSPSDAAKYLGVSRARVYEFMKDDTLAWYEVPATRGRRIRMSDLDRLVRRGHVPTTDDVDERTPA